MTDEGPDESEDDVLEPEDLDVRNDDRVRQLDGNRFFVSTSDEGEVDAPADDRLGTAARGRPEDPDRPRDDPSAPVGRDAGGEQPLRDVLADVDGQYAIAAAARMDAGTAAYTAGTNNVAETFEAFLRWYAEQVGDGKTPDEEVLRILLAETDLDV